MATSLDKRISPIVLKTINKYGTDATFHVRVVNNVDFIESEVTGSNVSYTFKVTPPDQFEKSKIDGKRIRQTDLRILAPGSKITFDINKIDKVTVHGKDYEVTNVEPIASGDDIAAYEFQLRSDE